VVLQADREFRNSPEDLRSNLRARRGGEMVPLDAVTAARFTMGPDLIRGSTASRRRRSNGAGAGLQLGTGNRRHGAARQGSSPRLRHRWSGQAYEEKQAGGASAAGVRVRA